MSETAGKTARVVGTFVLMIGAGLVLDRNQIRAGVGVMFLGGASYVWGLLLAIQRHRADSRPAAAAPAPASAPEATTRPPGPADGSLPSFTAPPGAAELPQDR